MSNERMGWSEIVRERRESLDLTQEQLANVAGVSLKTIGNLEGSGTTPQARTLGKIRIALGLSSDPVVAAEQARQRSGLGRVLGQKEARPIRRTGLDGYLHNMALRIEELEIRVAALELSEASGTLADTEALAALDSDEEAGAPEE